MTVSVTGCARISSATNGRAEEIAPDAGLTANKPPGPSREYTTPSVTVLPPRRATGVTPATGAPTAAREAMMLADGSASVSVNSGDTSIGTVSEAVKLSPSTVTCAATVTSWKVDAA